MERPDFFTLKNGEKAKLPFSNSEYDRRINNLKIIMDKNNLDMVILTSMHNIAYYTGFIFGITSSVGFSVFSVSLRWRKETPKFTTTAFAGFLCVIFASIMILSNDLVFFSSSYNSSLISLHGTLVCLGLILYSIGSKAIPAAELTLLSLTEVIGGIFWVWLPLFGINEIPATNTIIGGFFLFISLTYYSLVMRWNKRYIGLN